MLLFKHTDFKQAVKPPKIKMTRTGLYFVAWLVDQHAKLRFSMYSYRVHRGYINQQNVTQHYTTRKQPQKKMFHLTGQLLLYFLKSLSRACIDEIDLFLCLLILMPSSHMDMLHILLVVLLGNSSKFVNNLCTFSLLLH